MSEYIVTLKQLAILVAKSHGEELVNVDGTPIFDPREIAEVVDEPLTLNSIVRCGDCKEYIEFKNHATCGFFGGDYVEVKPDGFCAWGEPKVREET